MKKLTAFIDRRRTKKVTGTEKANRTEELSRAEQVNRTPSLYTRLPATGRPIRLLKLLPAPTYDLDIQVEILYSSLDRSPRYEALSYVWGDPKITTQIQVHDMYHEVTVNLALALRYLRHRDEERILWVDALCINQLDIPEKTSQVAQMRGIYTGTEQVLVWLGEEEDARIVLEFSDNDESYSNASPDVWDSASNLFSRPWWKRTWILQEVMHSRPVIVHIGAITITLDDLLSKLSSYERQKRIVRSLANLQESRFQHPQSAVRYRRNFMEAAMTKNIAVTITESRRNMKDDPNHVESLTASLNNFRDQLSTDPRDKVFALMSMVDNTIVTVDYARSLEDVYIDTAGCLLLGLSLLWVESPNRPITARSLPSWVPDWTTVQNPTQKAMAMYSVNWNASAYKGARDDPMRIASTKDYGYYDGKKLCFDGVYVGVVSRVKIVYPEFDVDHPQDWRFNLFKYSRDPAMRHYKWPAMGTNDDGPEYQKMTMRNSSWGPYWVKLGDVIVVSRVCTVPLVLRRDSESAEYLFVGTCWLIDHDLQWGQAESQMPWGQAVSEDFLSDAGFSWTMQGTAWDLGRVEKFRLR